jgi:hypothetical protein
MRCISEDYVHDIFHDCHDQPCVENYAAKRTTYNILQVEYYWPTLHIDVQQYTSHCDECQRMRKLTKRNEMPLQPQVLVEPFDKWGMEFISLIDPPSGKKRHILVCTDYMTKWDEVKAMKDATKQNVVAFLQECIFSRFGYPREIVTNQGPQFTSRIIEEIMKEHNIHHRKSTPYHPQANGQAEVTNQELENILTIEISMNKKNWSKKLIEVAWAYNITWNTTTGLTPFELVYGKKVMLPIEFEYWTLRTITELDTDLPSTQREILSELNALDEYIMQILFNTEVVNQQRKYWHDKKVKNNKFKEGDWTLLYDSRFKDFKGNLMTKWLGLYTIEKCYDNGIV